MLRSSIDLGTNTCLLLIADCEESSRAQRIVKGVIEDCAQIVRLGEGVDQNKSLNPAAMKRTLQCLEQYAVKVRAAGLEPCQTLAVATSQARDSANAAEFFAEIKAKTGFKFRELTGDEEAKFTFFGALLPEMAPESSVVIDIGGGSTEIVNCSSAQLTGESLDMGSVRFTERFLKSDPVTDQEFWSCQEAIDKELLRFSSQWPTVNGEKGSYLVGVAGTCTSLASLYLELPHFDRDQMDGLELTRGDIHRLVEELKWRSTAERLILPGMEKGRADVLLAGALILWRTMERLQYRCLKVSTRGLRFGVITS